MLKIYLTRHGQDVDNSNGILNGHRDQPLTELGIRQATEAGNQIKNIGLKFDHVYASPLQRTLKTAQIISDISGNPQPTKLPLLIERDFGTMTGAEQCRITELCAPDILQVGKINYFLKPIKGETFPKTIIRAKKLLKYITDKHDDGSILLVTHGDMGKMVYTAYYNLPWKETLELFHFGNTDLLLLSEHSDPADVYVFSTEQYNL